MKLRLFCYMLMVCIMSGEGFCKVAGAAFLRLGVDPRAVGLGNAYTAAANSPTAIDYNPAALAHINLGQLFFMKNVYLLGVHNEYLAWTQPYKNMSIGASINYLHTEDVRRDTVGVELGIFKNSYIAVSGGLAKHVTDRLSIGGSGKFVYGKLDETSAWGVGGDFGLLYKVLDNLDLGVVVQNLGLGLKFKEERDWLPLNFKGAIAYHYTKLPNIPILLCAEVYKPIFSDLRLNLGGEVSYRNFINFQCGLSNIGAKTLFEGINVGVSVKPTNWLQVSYSFSPTQDFGNIHRFGLQMNFSETKVVEVSANITVNPKVLTPDGDGIADYATLTLTVLSPHPIDNWSLTILSKEKQKIRHYTGSGAPPKELVWHCDDEKGEKVDEGVYICEFECTDSQGHKIKARPKRVVVQRIAKVTLPQEAITITPPKKEITPTIREEVVQATASVTVNPSVLTPDGDGIADYATLTLTASSPHPIDNWSLTILSKEKQKIRHYTGRGTPPKELVWHCDDKKGKKVDEGIYICEFECTDSQGHKIKAQPKRVVVQRIAKVTLPQEAITITPPKEEITPTITPPKEEITPIIRDDKIEVIRTTPEISTLRIAGDVLFDSGSARVKVESHSLLSQIAQYIHENLNKIKKIRIEGHTDNIPIGAHLRSVYADNKALSYARALAVFHHFVKKENLPANIFETIGHGETKPIASNATAEGRAKNRRVDITIIEK